jgi:hypothetical protein
MARFELMKSIEARKLIKRTGQPSKEGWITIPFGAIVEDLASERDMVRFTYLGELYQCAHDIVSSALSKEPIGGFAPPAEPDPAPAPEPLASDPPAPESEPIPASLDFERLDRRGHSGLPLLSRAKIPGGWLVVAIGAVPGGVTFVPDPEHRWDGGSLP